MAEQWIIDGEQLFEFLSDQLIKETGAFSKGVNKGLNIARSAIHNADAVKPIDPETLPIVRQLRADLARVTAERDAALRELRSIQTHTRSLRDYVDNEIHPVVDYSIYLNLREAVDTIDSWQHITPDGAIKEATP